MEAMNETDPSSAMQEPGAEARSSASHFEDNWKTGRFVNFQFPHPDHADEGHTFNVYALQCSENYLVSCSSDRSIRIWNISTQRLALPPLFSHEASILCVQFDLLSDKLVSGDAAGHVTIWQFSTGAIVKKIENAHSGFVLSLRFNENYVVTSSKDESIKVWNRGSFTLARTLNGHTDPVNAIQLTDKYVISASSDRKIKIWNLATGKCLRTITGHERGIACLHLIADGTKFITGSFDKTLRISNISGAEIARLSGHSDLVRTVQASLAEEILPETRVEHRSEPSAKDNELLSINRIVSGSHDGTIAIWEQRSDKQWFVRQRLEMKDTLRTTSTHALDDAPEDEAVDVERIFALHFYERRLICCGQGGKILGCDFGALQGPTVLQRQAKDVSHKDVEIWRSRKKRSS
jgi:WD40 repeat protein